MNVSEILQSATLKLREKGIDSSVLDAQVLVASAIGKDRAFLLSHPEYQPNQSQIRKINSSLKRRLLFEPIAYILGHKEFFGLDFLVNKNVLVPRPESEFLVEEGLCRISHFAKASRDKQNSEYRIQNVLDLGTGSGNIIISLSLQLQQCSNLAMNQCSFYASDISTKALSVTKRNALKYSSKITFVHSDLFANKKLHRKFDLIIANLPYVPTPSVISTHPEPAVGRTEGGEKSYHSEINSIAYEPTSAIFAKDNGAAIIKKFLVQSKNYLTVDGTILIELDPRNAIEIKTFAGAVFPAAKIELMKDLAKRERYLIIEIK